MINRSALIALLMMLLLSLWSVALRGQNKRIDGYRGIWYSLNQFSEYGDKYSGGLGTYTSNHVPMAVYSPEVDKTFFVYGGTTQEDEKHLLIMISYFDHKTKMVPKPVVALDKMGVDDPHDNATISIDEEGYIWLFVSGRNVSRLGSLLKSSEPYSINNFELVRETNMTYAQPWYFEGKGFVNLFTQYAPGTHFRELWWSTSFDGVNWSYNQKLAAIFGHYQVSNQLGNRLVTAFNYHVDGHADKRTNVYFLQTEDMGLTWKSVDGQLLETPVTNVEGPALVYDYEDEGKLVYLQDINFDAEGNPIILVLVSSHFQPGPKGQPREWVVFHWKDNRWISHTVCTSTHNYDVGSLYVDDNKWFVVGPSGTGPQEWGAGGEMALWRSRNEGTNWKKVRDITNNSRFNHSYARRPVNVHPDFYAFWADGNPDEFSRSSLYFTNRKGNRVWRLPYHMDEDYQKPLRVKCNRK